MIFDVDRKEGLWIRRNYGLRNRAEYRESSSTSESSIKSFYRKYKVNFSDEENVGEEEPKSVSISLNKAIFFSCLSDHTWYRLCRGFIKQ